MSPHEVVTIEDDETMATSSHDDRRPFEAENRSPGARSSPRSGRVLYCRKCEGHGEKVILKNHAPSCPYILCNCRSCERLNQKRLKSFNKRNKEKLELAAMLTEQRRREREEHGDGAPSRKVSSCSSHSSTMDSENANSRTGLEGRSMSLGAMTVMSYDIWKAKCAAEKKRLEEEGKLNPADKKDDILPQMRKRAHTFIAPTEAQQELPKVQPPNVKEKKGRYIVLPTIPAMKIFVDEEDEKKVDERMDVTPAPAVENQVHEMKISSPVAVKPTVTPIQAFPQLPATTISPIQHTMLKTPITVVPTMPMAPALSVAPALQRQAPMTFSTPQPQPQPVISQEHLVLLQNNILQQQNQALQQLLGLLPLHHPTTAASPAPDMMSLLRCQQMAQMAAKASMAPTNEELLQSLLAQTRPQQAIFSHGM